jgi:hypothetical protein
MDPIAKLLLTYGELNGAVITELDAEPSALEYMRFVALNTPFVVRGAASEWRATRLWNRTYLEDAMKNQTVNVAVTPKGSESISNTTIEFRMDLLTPSPEMPILLFQLKMESYYSLNHWRKTKPLKTCWTI